MVEPSGSMQVGEHVNITCAEAFETDGDAWPVCQPAAALCEVLDDEGGRATRDRLGEIATKNKLHGKS